jgi:hypothetical protein
MTDLSPWVAIAIMETVGEAEPDGIAAGSICAALTEQGYSLDQYEQILAALVARNFLHKQGDVYYV